MWKVVGVAVLRCGAIYGIFGVLGIVYYIVKWSRPLRRRSDPQPIDPEVL